MRQATSGREPSSLADGRHETTPYEIVDDQRALPLPGCAMSRGFARAGAVVFCLFALAIENALFATGALAHVLVVVSDDSPVYQQAADEIKARLAPLREGRLRIDVLDPEHAASSVDADGKTSFELIVTIGLGAAQAIASRHPIQPTLCLLIQKQSFDELARRDALSGRRMSAIFLEQPVARQLDLVALALPGKTQIGAVFGPASAALAPAIEESARQRGLEVKRADVDDARDLYAAMQKVMSQSDVLLALPDPVALNASNARDFLMTSYRARVPVVAFSQAFVDAGAVVAVYSTPRQQAREGAEIAASMLTGNATLPLPDYPRYFTVGVNFFAARALGLKIDDQTALANALATLASARARSRGSSTSPELVGAMPGKGP